MMQVTWFGPLKMMKVKLCNSNYSNLHARYFPPLIVYIHIFSIDNKYTSAYLSNL